MLRFSLAYFSLCDCSQVVIFPSRHLSPCQHGEAHCRQYPCLWTHIDDALLLSCDSPPLLMAFGFSLQPRWEDGLCKAYCFLCLERIKRVLVAEVWGLPCHMCLYEWEGGHEQLRKIYFTPRKHLYLLFSEQKSLIHSINIQICKRIDWKEFLKLVVFFGDVPSETNSASLFKCILPRAFLTDLIYPMSS